MDEEVLVIIKKIGLSCEILGLWVFQGYREKTVCCNSYNNVYSQYTVYVQNLQ